MLPMDFLIIWRGKTITMRGVYIYIYIERERERERGRERIFKVRV